MELSDHGADLAPVRGRVEGREQAWAGET
jgi:hypothetical protein